MENSIRNHSDSPTFIFILIELSDYLIFQIIIITNKSGNTNPITKDLIEIYNFTVYGFCAFYFEMIRKTSLYLRESSLT